MKKKIATRLREEKGASLVEFAIILPLLIIVIFGIIEFSILLYDKAVITNAGREGARFGSLFTIIPGSKDENRSRSSQSRYAITLKVS